MQLKTYNQVKPKKQLAADKLNERLVELIALGRLNSWNSFIEELQVPGDLQAALLTGRGTLVKIAPPRALSAEECETLYKLIGGLIDTNAALREHAAEVAHLVDLWAGSFTQLDTLGRRIQHYANFRVPEKEEEEQED
jgi:hypothetical protein